MPVLVVKPRLERFRELIGSMLIATAVAAVACVVSVLIMVYNDKAPVETEQCAWLFVVGLAGAWIVLVAGKLWEGREGEQLLRRFVLMVAGLGLGLAAFGVADAFHVRLQPEAAPTFTIGPPPAYGHAAAGASSPVFRPTLRIGPPLSADFYRDGHPQLMAYMAVFATLLILVRWWRQADPLRPSRLSVIWVAVPVVAAYLASAFWQFPQPWLMMVAGCMSVAVQLASPWVPTYARLRPQRKKVV